jgi:hypothetical protein
MRSASPYEKFGEVAPVTDAFLTLHTFDASETITGLAHRYFNDWTQWRLIADRNGITDPRSIAPGAQLLIPEKPRELGSFESR